MNNDNWRFNCHGKLFLELQEAENICKAAYREIMALAVQENTWVNEFPALGSVQDLQQMFKTPPSPGMRVEHSVETALIPLSPDVLINSIIELDKWGSIFSHIVHQPSEHEPSGVLPLLLSSKRFNFHPAHRTMYIKMINAKFRLPTPFVPNRKFSFIRFVREIIPMEAWAIIDVSSDFFQHGSLDYESKGYCKRRPSGVIIWGNGSRSKVIWIENVEVPKFSDEDNMYSKLINSNLAFSSKHWVSAILQSCNRNQTLIVNNKLLDFPANAVRDGLLELTSKLKVAYMSCINEDHDETIWELLSDVKGVKILKDTDSLENNHMAVTSFRVEANPIAVFDFLVKRNMELQWPNTQNPSELVKLATTDDSYRVTLHERFFSPKKLTEDHRYEYLVQEATRDEFCSSVISSTPTHFEIKQALRHGVISAPHLRASGFAIMPDGGSKGLQSDASLVTIAIQQELDDHLEASQVIEVMTNLMSLIVGEISEAGTL